MKVVMPIEAKTSEPRKQTSTEYGGTGQSGYTAGRGKHDLALERELESRNLAYPRSIADDQLRDELGTDDRFLGRGGRPWPDDEDR